MTKSSPVLLSKEKGELVNYNGQEYVILKIIDLTKVLAQNIVNKTTEVLEIQHLTPWVVKQDDETEKNDIDLSSIPEEDWQIARDRLKIIQPLLSGIEWGSAKAEKIAEKSGYGVATIHRWVRLYRNTGLLSSLLPVKRGWVPGKWRLRNDQVC